MRPLGSGPDPEWAERHHLVADGQRVGPNHLLRPGQHGGPGRVVLDGPPQRVFIADSRAPLDDLLALDVRPAAVAISATEVFTPWSV